ncbi:ATP-dependent DNA helicase [Heracleum sosnowskyi]|uniref:ATP-dependent DNA helicase n=1 Tax=Heracleum sosnowskyi TaxID=360622 RepID=A0AAD8M6S9_9APIA|nr:ATP-dependent DNA helicase [Heracleum sosnowskyi]
MHVLYFVSLLLSGGRTARARFAIPININENSISGIRQGSDLAVLLERTKLLIWDEAPMAHNYCFEAMDRTCRDVLRSSNSRNLEQPFGGMLIVFGCDFQQILPVVLKGRRQDIISATIN